MIWKPQHPGFWLMGYFAELLELDRGLFPSLAAFEHALGPVQVIDEYIEPLTDRAAGR